MNNVVHGGRQRACTGFHRRAVASQVVCCARTDNGRSRCNGRLNRICHIVERTAHRELISDNQRATRGCGRGCAARRTVVAPDIERAALAKLQTATVHGDTAFVRIACGQRRQAVARFDQCTRPTQWIGENAIAGKIQLQVRVVGHITGTERIALRRNERAGAIDERAAAIRVVAAECQCAGASFLQRITVAAIPNHATRDTCISRQISRDARVAC